MTRTPAPRPLTPAQARVLAALRDGWELRASGPTHCVIMPRYWLMRDGQGVGVVDRAVDSLVAAGLIRAEPGTNRYTLADAGGEVKP